MMAAGELVHRPITPFGCAVDLDLSQPLSPDDRQGVCELLYAHGLLVFRKQMLDLEQQVELMSAFGPVRVTNLVSTDPQVGWGGRAELKFHSDLAFSPYPCKVMSLYGVDVTDGETSTLFASGLLAWRQISDHLKAQVRGLQSRMELPRLYADDGARAEKPDWLPWTDHDAVMAHPVTGEPLLFVNEMQTARLMGIEEPESAALMEELFAQLYAPANIYEHAWNRGDLVIWDNIAAQHARGALPAHTRRTLQRVIVAEKLFSELYPDVPKAELGVD